MIDRENIDSTFQRIEKSLNLRFQKNGSYYISKDDSEIIRKTLYNREFQNYFAFGSKVGTPVIVQIVLKNPWLLNFNLKSNKDFTRNFSRLLEEDERNQLMYLSLGEKIVNDKIFSTIDFKEFVEKYYYNNVNISICKNRYSADGVKASIKKICFFRVLQNSGKGGSYIIRNIAKVFDNNPDLYTAVKDTNYLNNIIVQMSEKKEVAEWLLENKVSSDTDQIWTHAFTSLGDHGFKVARKYVEEHDTFRDELTKYMVRKVFEKFLRIAKRNEKDGVDINTYIHEISDLYSSFNTKVLFFDMLGRNFNDRDLALKILEEFDEVGIPERYDERVKEIREVATGNRNEKFSSPEDAFEKISGLTNLGNKGTLLHILMRLKVTKFGVIDELYGNFHDDENVKLVLCFFFAKSIQKPEVSNYLLRNSISESYVDLIAEYIESEQIDNKSVRKFLLRSGKHEQLKKLLER